MIHLENFAKLQKACTAHNAELIAVSKTKPIEAIEALYKEGQRAFGENYVQELADKHTHLAQDIEWHFIGHLQSKKVKYIAPFVHCVHAVDSYKLLTEIDKRAAQNERSIDCLLQIHIAQESSKFGLDEQELQDLLVHPELAQLQNVRICGLMGMATFTNDMEQVKKEFQFLKNLFEKTQAEYFNGQAHFKELSMGMSGDYELALEMGSTMIRVGSLLFGSRNYG